MKEKKNYRSIELISSQKKHASKFLSIVSIYIHIYELNISYWVIEARIELLNIEIKAKSWLFEIWIMICVWMHVFNRRELENVYD